MKKFSKYMLVALAMVFCIAIGVSAVSWSVGEGFSIYEGSDYASRMDTGVVSPVITSYSGGSIVVSQGGYYESPYSNSSGIASNENLNLNGLEVKIKFDKVPAISGDCWFSIGLMKQAKLFDVSNFSSNAGVVSLVRYGTPKVEVYGPSSFSTAYNGGTNYIFNVRTGDTLTFRTRYSGGRLSLIYEKGESYLEIPSISASTLGGYAHLVLAGSTVGTNSDWKYTVTVKENSFTTLKEQIEEQKKAQLEEEKKKLEAAKDNAEAKLDEYLTLIETLKENAYDAVSNKYYQDNNFVLDYFNSLDNVIDDVSTLYVSLSNANSEEEIGSLLDEAEKLRDEAVSLNDSIVLEAQYLMDYDDYLNSLEDDDKDNYYNVVEVESAVKDELEDDSDSYDYKSYSIDNYDSEFTLFGYSASDLQDLLDEFDLDELLYSVGVDFEEIEIGISDAIASVDEISSDITYTFAETVSEFVGDLLGSEAQSIVSDVMMGINWLAVLVVIVVILIIIIIVVVVIVVAVSKSKKKKSNSINNQNVTAGKETQNDSLKQDKVNRPVPPPPPPKI